MAVRFSSFVLLSIFSWTLTSPVYSREPKENKRVYTYNLLRYLQLLDFSLDGFSGVSALREARVNELNRLHEVVSGKLTKKKKAKLDVSFRLCSVQKGIGRLEPCGRHRHVVLDLFRIVVVPAVTPDKSRGRLLYQKKCISCHGSSGLGDGSFTKNLHYPMIPPPGNFQAQIRESRRTPFSYFNSILIGSTSTAMKSYQKDLSINDIWNLAFYVSSLSSMSHEMELQIPEGLTLSDISVYNNQELMDKFPQVKSLSAFRSYFPFDTRLGR